MLVCLGFGIGQCLTFRVTVSRFEIPHRDRMSGKSKDQSRRVRKVKGGGSRGDSKVRSEVYGVQRGAREVWRVWGHGRV